MVLPGFLHIVQLGLHCLEYLLFLFTVFGFLGLYVTNCLLGTEGTREVEFLVIRTLRNYALNNDIPLILCANNIALFPLNDDIKYRT